MKQNSKDILDIKIVTHKDGKDKVVEFQYRKSSINEKTMALDVLLQAQDTILPNLAFRYGCRARNCDRRVRDFARSEAEESQSEAQATQRLRCRDRGGQCQRRRG